MLKSENVTSEKEKQAQNQQRNNKMTKKIF